MNFNEGLKLKGIFYLEIRDGNGDLIERYRDENLIVNGGRDAIVKLIGGSGVLLDKTVSQISFGTDGASPLITDTILTNPFNKAVDGVTFPATETVQFDFSLALAENNGVTIREFGLLTVDNTLFSRKTRSPIVKTGSISLAGFWSITF